MPGMFERTEYLTGFTAIGEMCKSGDGAVVKSESYCLASFALQVADHINYDAVNGRARPWGMNNAFLGLHPHQETALWKSKRPHGSRWTTMRP